MIEHPDTSVYRVYTYHKTQILINAKSELIHRKFENTALDHLPVYARFIDGGISFFVIKNNRIEYLATPITMGGGG